MLKNSFKLFIILLLIINNDVLSQSVISSPYSRYGIGEMYNNKYARNSSIGGIGTAFRNSRYINYFNPASYTASDSMWVVFENAINGNYVKLSNNQKSEEANYAALSSLLIQFPITKWWAASFGLLPYSKVGYKIIENKTLLDSNEFSNKYKGTGGLNTFYIGNGIKISKNLSIGFNTSILFGNIERITDLSTYSAYMISSNSEVDYTVNAILFKYGIQYENNINENYKYSLGMFMSNPQNAKYKKSILAYTYKQTESTIINKDTISDLSVSNLKIELPLHLSFGAVITKNNKWLAGVDYQYIGFQDFKFLEDESQNFKNNNIISVGMQTLSSPNSSKYLKRMTYGLGFRYSDGYLKFQNTNITEYAITFGAGLPIRRSNSVVNLGFEIGQRGTKSNNLLKENFATLNITFAFAERWFYKRKFD